jgi:hypothetical protein
MSPVVDASINASLDPCGELLGRADNPQQG